MYSLRVQWGCVCARASSACARVRVRVRVCVCVCVCVCVVCVCALLFVEWLCRTLGKLRVKLRNTLVVARTTAELEVLETLFQ